MSRKLSYSEDVARLSALPTLKTALGLPCEQIAIGIRYRCVETHMSVETWIGDNGLIVYHDRMAPMEFRESVRNAARDSSVALPEEVDEWQEDNEQSWGGHKRTPNIAVYDAWPIFQKLNAQEGESLRRTKIVNRKARRKLLVERQRRMVSLQ